MKPARSRMHGYLFIHILMNLADRQARVGSKALRHIITICDMFDLRSKALTFTIRKQGHHSPYNIQIQTRASSRSEEGGKE
jgi:hypothetical protein